MLRGLIRSIAERAPSQCAVCQGWPAQPVCEACVVRFAQPRPRCRTCALPVTEKIDQCGACVRQKPALDACVAAVAYEYPWSQLIAQFKFGQRPGWASSLAGLMRSAPWVEPALEQADLVLPMPLSTPRMAQRGFNQSLELARQLAPLKTAHGLLLRIQDTPPQTALKRAQRLRNVRHAFAVEPLRRAELAGRRIVIVDDVMTSGASLFAAASALRAAGAAHITGMVLARADLPTNDRH